MKLLIVDDIPTVVKGLIASISWEELGFSTVYPAYNALEARAVLNREAIDVMLCDIQMPVESGLALFTWMGSQGMKTRTIFLTSHADFAYAQRALKLGSFDYIVQPAPYSEVYDTVRRAVKEIEREKKEYKNVVLGKVFRRQEYMLASNCFRDMLNENPSWENYAALEKLGRLPERDGQIYLVLLHVYRWDARDIWESGLFHMAINNVLSELFEASNGTLTLAFMETDYYAIGLPAGAITADEAERQLYFFSSVCRQYFECETALYMSSLITIGEAPKVWNRLMDRSRENIGLSPGVFRLEKQMRNSYVYRVPEIAQWGAFLKEGYPETMEESAVALLDQMVAEGRMNARTLMVFQLDFVEMLRTVTGENYITEILNNSDNIEIYRNSIRSVDGMKQFIHLAAGIVEPKEDLFDSRTLVERITRYINEHLDGDLKRDDLAEYANLSPDYLTRIFKKEMGIPIKEYIIRQKMEIARKLLQTTNLPVSFIAAKVGYSNFSHFSHTYKKEMGITPQEERKGK